MKVVHISSVHPGSDPRIRFKEIRTVLEAGHEVVYVTGDRGYRDGCLAVRYAWPGNKSRAARIMLTAPIAMATAYKERADIYHFHDPELLPWAWILSFWARNVVYDVHEDNVTSILQKRYLPALVRKCVARSFGLAEQFFARRCHCVVAERYYQRRFPRSVVALNYPNAELSGNASAHDGRSNKLLYTGNVTYDRGALNLARLARIASSYEIYTVGKCDTRLAHEMGAVAGSGAGRARLRQTGVGVYVQHQQIQSVYRNNRWLAGLAIFPRTPHYMEKELTKFFEYMAFGIPIIASDFPVWRRLIEGRGVGICVDPDSPTAVVDAADWLRGNPDDAAEMGRRGQALIAKELNWEHEGIKLLDLYREVERNVGR